jgi:hypothetical protein
MCLHKTDGVMIFELLHLEKKVVARRAPQSACTLALQEQSMIEYD